MPVYIIPAESSPLTDWVNQTVLLVPHEMTIQATNTPVLSVPDLKYSSQSTAARMCTIASASSQEQLKRGLRGATCT
jgi:hypothetical protein